MMGLDMMLCRLSCWRRKPILETIKDLPIHWSVGAFPIPKWPVLTTNSKRQAPHRERPGSYLILHEKALKVFTLFVSDLTAVADMVMLSFLFDRSMFKVQFKSVVKRALGTVKPLRP
ncbi:hypothetical protein KP509_31G068600 [Ceratopteris richardii]|uniref:Uncharacterized protein n=1 Tax=Ceratopteris richardii TaxID=49495 RepID=A0A8T2R0R8_CERRI|nr:hypothetical protein KP509_31G068600 [Ceratopteris richardii]